MPSGPTSGTALGEEVVPEEAEGCDEGECAALGGDPPPHDSVRRAVARRTAPTRISRTNVTATAQTLRGGFHLLDAFRPRALRIIRAGLEHAVPAAPLDHRLPAYRAGLVQQLRPLAGLAVLADVGAVLALRIARAGDERSISPGPFDQLPFIAHRALFTRRLGLCRGVALDVLALRVARAADEFAVPTRALLQRPAAVRALLFQQLRFGHLSVWRQRAPKLALRIARAAEERPEPARLANQMALVAQRADLFGVRRRRFFSRGEHLLQRAVEVADHRNPLFFAALHLVEALLERRGVGVIGDDFEVVDHDRIHRFADASRVEPALLQLDVAVVLDRLDDRRIRGGTADASLLELADQGRLGVARRRLSEVLLGLDPVVVEVFATCQLW